MLYLGSDHRGYALKEHLKKRLSNEGIVFSDLGNDHLDPVDDYVVFSKRVADEVAKNEDNRGVVLCGSGVGVDITANKVDGIRCALVFDKERAAQSRQHENANMIALPADILPEESAFQIIKTFLQTPFSKESRHIRRLAELEKVEDKHR